MSEQPLDAKNMYETHKIDVKAVRELGGLAAVGGNMEPGSKLDLRSEILLERSGGDADAAAQLAKNEINRINEGMKREVAEHLPHYIAEAKEDMAREKPTPTPIRHMEAQLQIDPTTGKVSQYLPLSRPY